MIDEVSRRTVNDVGSWTDAGPMAWRKLPYFEKSGRWPRTILASKCDVMSYHVAIRKLQLRLYGALLTPATPTAAVETCRRQAFAGYSPR